jgi:hypothetical protein
LLSESNGCGGYHLRILFGTPVPCRALYHFLGRTAIEVGFTGEFFPKQPTLAPPGQRGAYGNWLRLPGRHHSQEFWSRVYDGERWLSGGEAVTFLLTFHGDPPCRLPASPPPVRTRRARRPFRAPYFRGRLADQIEAYRRRLPHLAEGQGRDDVAYRFAAFLVRDVAVSDDVALEWLSLWDAGNRPPKGESRLREILASAHRYGRHAYGTGRA